jgi:hypothetical protein
MTKDDRDILELLEEELTFVEQGGYGRSVRTPWLQKSIFQDSLSCLNYGYPYRAHPCNECSLIDFVEPQYQTASVPCHFIPLNDTRQTVAELESMDNQPRLEETIKSWLRAKISTIREQRASQDAKFVETVG